MLNTHEAVYVAFRDSRTKDDAQVRVLDFASSADAMREARDLARQYSVRVFDSTGTIWRSPNY